MSRQAGAPRSEQQLSTARLAVHALRKHYGAIQAVDGLSFEVEPGEIFGLLGPNGAGKTTTVEAIAGLIAPDAGTVHVCGMDVRAMPRAAKQQLGVALQTTGFQEGVTPREAVEAFGCLFPKAVATASLLKRFGLEAKADARVNTLSGGEKQRLALAMALVNDPQVLLLDEPTVGLDVHMRREFHAHIRALREDGRAILLTTHDMDEATQLCDRIVVIDHGRIVAAGTPTELIASLRSATRIRLVADRALDSAWFAAERFHELRCEGAELSFTAADPRAALAALLTVLEEHGMQVVQLNVGKGTLEDAILDIVASQAHG